MHASHKWIRRALLGGVALSVMATGAQAADDLSGLKAQLEALQARVNQIEAQPAATRSAALPEGASFISIRRGSNMPGFNDDVLAEPGTQIPTDRGFTISVMPTADMPAPIMEVTVSGYVKADFIYDTHNDMGDFASQGAVALGTGDVEHLRFHARESRFRIKSRSDTAVGQIRTLIEVDFYGGGANQLISSSDGVRMRHAWGEWDISPSTTLGFGQFWSTWFPIGFAPPKLDFTSPAGAHFMRTEQFRVTHRSGPWTTTLALNNPETDIRTAAGVGSAESIGNPAGANDEAPDVALGIQYGSGGHAFKLSGIGRVLSTDVDAGAVANDSVFGYGVQANVRLALTSAFTLYATGIWGDGIGRYLLHNVTNAAVVTASGNLKTLEAYGLNLGIKAKMSPTTTFTAQYGYFHQDDTPAVAGILETGHSVHATVFWQPVSKFKLGLEGIWRYDEDRANAATGTDHDENFRLHAAAQFFF